MFDPSIGRWLEEDPIDFDAGDPNLYRYCGNNPTNATDPTGAVILFKSQQDAEAFSEKMKTTYKAKHLLISKTPEAYANEGFPWMVLGDGRDRAAFFAFADDQFAVWNKRDFGLQTPEWQKHAVSRNHFLLASGAITEEMGKYLSVPLSEPGRFLTDERNPTKSSFNLVIAQHRKDDPPNTVYYPPVILDIGGESGDKGRINVNIWGWDTGGKPDQKLPFLLIRIGKDGGIPSSNRITQLNAQSADEIIMESTPITPGTTTEIVRLIKPGGKVTLFNPDNVTTRD